MAAGSISKRSVDALKAGTANVFLWDAGDGSTKGFGLKLTPAGSRSYVFQYRLGGREAKTKRLTIGKHGAWNPTSARAEAERLARLVSQGIDPVAEKARREREAVDLAFRAYAGRFYDACEGEGWRKLVERTLRLHVSPVLGDTPLPSIRRSDIALIMDRHATTAKGQRRNTFAVLRKLFRWAIGRGDLERSPLDGMDAPPAVQARDRVLSDDDLRRIWCAAEHGGKLFGPIVRLLMATGQRREEVSLLDWGELDRKAALWSLPRERAKNQESHTVPLSPLVVCILDEVARGEKWPRRGLVFATSGDKAFTAFAKGKLRIDKLIAADGGDELKPWRLHDLRRTLATGLQRLGVRFEVTEAVLNHLSGSRAGVAGVYQRHTWADEKRTALEAWGGHIQSLLSPSVTSNVYLLAARA